MNEKSSEARQLIQFHSTNLLVFNYLSHTDAIELIFRPFSAIFTSFKLKFRLFSLLSRLQVTSDVFPFIISSIYIFLQEIGTHPQSNLWE